MSTPDPHPPHSRKDRPKVPKGHKWTLEERMTLHLLFHEYDLPDHDLQEIFHATHPSLRQEGYNYVYMHLRDDYRQRFANGKSKMWSLVDHAGYSAQEFAAYAVLREAIRRSAAGLGLQLTVSIAPGSQSLHAPPGLASQAFAPALQSTSATTAVPGGVAQNMLPPTTMPAAIAPTATAPGANPTQAFLASISSAPGAAQTSKAPLQHTSNVAQSTTGTAFRPQAPQPMAPRTQRPYRPVDTAEDHDMSDAVPSSSPLPTAANPYPARRTPNTYGWNAATEQFSDGYSIDDHAHPPALTNMNAVNQPTSMLGLLQHDLARFPAFHESDDEDIIVGPANYRGRRGTTSSSAQRTQLSAPVARGQRISPPSKRIEVSATTGRATVVPTSSSPPSSAATQPPSSTSAGQQQQGTLKGKGRAIDRSSATAHPAQAPPRQLSMLHYQSVGVRGGGNPLKKYWSLDYLKFKDNSELYRRGGQVISVYFRNTGKIEDVMVCDTSFCKICNAKGAIIPPFPSNDADNGVALPPTFGSGSPLSIANLQQQQASAKAAAQSANSGGFVPGPNDPPLRKLNMVHFMSLSLHEDAPIGQKVSSQHHFKFQDSSPICLHGGCVMRVYFPATTSHEDVIICDTSICTSCNPSATMLGDLSKNLPFVHLDRDVVHDKPSGNFRFEPAEQWQDVQGPLGGRKKLAVAFIGEGGEKITAFVNHCEIVSCGICQKVVAERMRREEEGEAMEVD